MVVNANRISRVVAASKSQLAAKSQIRISPGFCSLVKQRFWKSLASDTILIKGEKPMADLENQTDNGTVFACEMLAIEPAQRSLHLDNIKYIMEQVETRLELPDGYKLVLPLKEDLLVKTAQFIQLERLCCPFFNFSLELQARANTFSLSLTGPDGIKPFILAELGEYIPANIVRD